MPRRPKPVSARSKRSVASTSTSSTATINRDWREFLIVLRSHRTRFLLIGGHAVAVHAEARFTEDLDVFVEPSLANARRLRAALTEFGFGAILPSLRDLARPDQVIMLGRKPFRIDILTGISGVSFADAWKGRTLVTLDGLPLPVIGHRELILNKRASGRAKDLLDLTLLSRDRAVHRAKRSPS